MQYIDILHELRTLGISVFCRADPNGQLPRDVSRTLNITDLPFGSIAHFAMRNGLNDLIVPPLLNGDRPSATAAPIFVLQGMSQTLAVHNTAQVLHVGPLITCCAAVFFAGCETRGKYQKMSAYHVPSGIPREIDTSNGRGIFDANITKSWSTLSATAKKNSRFLFTCPRSFDRNYLKTIKSYTRWLISLGFTTQNICVFDTYSFEGTFLRVELNGYFGIMTSSSILEDLEKNFQTRQTHVPTLPRLLSQITNYKNSPGKERIPPIMQIFEDCNAILLATYDELLQNRLKNILTDLEQTATRYATWRDDPSYLGWFDWWKTSTPYKVEADIFDHFLTALRWPLKPR